MSRQPPDLTRRQLMTAVGAGSTAALVLPGTAAHAAPTFSSTPAYRVAMHVHGSWSEGWGSWESHLSEAAAAGVDVMYLTDHDNRATAYKYLTNLAGAVWETATTGSLAARTLTATSAGALRLVVESATSSAASGTLRVQPDPFAKNRLRTSISGLRIDHAFGAGSLPTGASYQIRVDLSHHPATAGRAAGRYAVIYRFGGSTRSRSVDSSGLVGTVRAPLPPAGTTVTLSPETDVAALWPSMWAQDNCFYGLSFMVTSSARGQRGDIEVRSCAFRRARSTPAAVSADQAALLSSYAPRFPSVQARRSTEIGRYKTHMNPFGIPQLFPDYSLDTPTNHDAFFTDLVADIHAAGGVVSLNHPFGYNGDPLLPAQEQVALRRTTYSSLAAVGAYGVDVLEVGYMVRGNVDAWTHLALWDTFSRNRTFLTGNGVSDDHSGQNWRQQRNGFFTGVWADSATDQALVASLKAGRAFFAHLGRWPGASLDLRLDDVARMGSVMVSQASAHRLSIAVANLPTGATVEVVRGPADRSGAVDPATSVAAVLTSADFVAGVATRDVTATSAQFLRVQVKDSAGALLGGGNPVWVLRSDPGGIPPSRRV